MSEITFGTVCSGIECASLAWEPLGWKPLWFSEIEQRACHLLKTRYPEVRNIGDMKGTLALIKDIKLKRPDVFAGGTPCQAFSSIGNNQGLLDPRAQLTKTFVEIANELSESWVLWENVPRVLSDKTNAFGHLLGGLCGSKSPIEPPSGHPWSRAGLVRGPTREVAWRVLDAQFFGLPQRRERVWLWQVLEDPEDVSKEHYLTPKAALGVLDRARKRGYKLTPETEAALVAASQQDSSD